MPVSQKWIFMKKRTNQKGNIIITICIKDNIQIHRLFRRVILQQASLRKLLTLRTSSTTSITAEANLRKALPPLQHIVVCHCRRGSTLVDLSSLNHLSRKHRPKIRILAIKTTSMKMMMTTIAHHLPQPLTASTTWISNISNNSSTK